MNPESIYPGALALAAPPELPDELVGHLSTAEAAASQNMEAVKAASTPELDSLRRQLRRAQTPAVPAASKVIRLRHIAGQWSTIFSSKTACSSGCSHCCHLAVMVPKSEAKLMAKAIGIHVTEPAEKLDLEGASDGTAFLGEPCTFLVDNRCSIYDHRPMMCRTLVNMDSVDTLCQIVKGVDVPVPYLNTVEMKAYFAYLTQTEQFADIRDWFPAVAPQMARRQSSRLI
jgi:Fe-S-cluster containining protein